MNKKGLTLIELLATILIIGVVMAISIVGSISYIEKSKEKKIAITTSNLIETAKIYVKEYYSNNDWIESNNFGELVSCVSTRQLVSNGLIEDKKISNLGIEYIILNKKENNSVIASNNLIYSKDIDKIIKNNENIYNIENSNQEIEEEVQRKKFEYEVCQKVALNPPEYLKKLSKSYTSAMEIAFEITPSFGSEEPFGRQIDTIDCKLTSDNYDIEVNNKGSEAGNIATCFFDKLRYKNDDDEEIKYNVYIEVKYSRDGVDVKTVNSTKSNLKLKPLLDPIILINNKRIEEEVYLREKNINIQYVNENIHPDIIPVREYSFDDFNSDNNDVITASNNNVDFSINDNKTIYVKISDGINSRIVNKAVKYIDNIDYMCDIEIEYLDDYKKAKLKASIYDQNDQSNNVSENIKGYMWEGMEYVKLSSKKTSNPITSKVYDVSGDVTVSLRNRRNEDVTCSGNPTELNVEPPDISIEVFRLSDNLPANENIWHNYDIYGLIKTTDEDATISYCVVDSEDASCEPVKNNVQVATISHTTNGVKKIIAISTNSNGRESSRKVAYLRVDKSGPGVPTGVVRNMNGENITSTFNPTGLNDWKNYKVTFGEFTATDSGGSGIDHYEYKNSSNDETSCNGDKTNILSNSYTYENVGYHFCIRSVDKAGNTSAWSLPYHFKIDTIVPGEASGIVKDASGTNITNTFNPTGTQTWKNYPVTFTDFSSSDNLSGIKGYEYTGTTNGATSCNNNTTVKALATSYSYNNVNYYYCIRSVDNAGNRGPWSKAYYFRIDTTSPSIPTGVVKNASGTNITNTFNPTGTNTWKNYKVIFTDFSATDNGTSNSGIDHFEFRNAGDGDKTCSGNKTNNLKNSYTYENVNYHFCIRSVDKAQNVSSWSPVYNFKTDTVAPYAKIEVYKRTESGGKTGQVLSTVIANNNNKNITLDNSSLANNVNGWLNKDKYPYGLYFEITYRDDIANNTKSGLQVANWSWNKSKLIESSSNVNSVSDSSNLNLNSENATGDVKAEGYRKEWLTLKDYAGNETKITVISKLDRTAPTFTFEGEECNKSKINNASNVNITDSVIVFKNSTGDIATTSGSPNYYCDTGKHASKYNLFNLKLTTTTKYETDQNILVRSRAVDSISKMKSIGLQTGGSNIKESSFDSDLTKCGSKDDCGRFKNVLGKGPNNVQFQACDVAGNCSTSTKVTLYKTTTCKESNIDDSNC